VKCAEQVQTTGISSPAFLSQSYTYKVAW